LLGDVFPEDEVAVVEGDHTVSQTLTELPFDHIFFTGSTAVGKIIMSAAAQNLASVTLELGGKSPVIVDEDADMEKAAERIAWGKVLNGGQTCVAPDYLLIAESKLDDFLQQSKNIIQEFYGENPMARRQSPDYCRIVNGRHYVRLRQLLEDSVKNGAEVVLGGDHADDENYIEPTYLANVDVDSAIMQEEIFGPILPILTYRSLGEAIEFINARDKPLALYVFSNNRENTEQILNRTSSGGAVVNDVIVHLANSHLPFGGVNHSGHGSYHGEFGFRALSHEKAVLRQSRLFSSIRLMYPPYTNLVKTIVNFTRKFLV
ncbi:MAG: aldehyde dehydrogenase family protein, partial [Leptospiraceae bacterium]|nr:aldehyde dehydrogenase family protein [Leptospiraceae bacterium]